MKKVSVAACVLASAAGVGLGAGSASAAPSSMYMHGTSKMTSFTSYAGCQTYATAEVNTVTSHGGKIVGGTDAGRTKCFPVSNGRWSYLIAYTAPKSVSSTDYTEAQATAQTGDSFWAFTHSESGPSATYTQAKCEAARNAFSQKVIASKNLRYLTIPACSVDTYSNKRGFTANYFGPSKTSGYAGDGVGAWSDSIVNEAATLGYSIPDAA